MGHAFPWGGELGNLSLNLPQASWLFRLTVLLRFEKAPTACVLDRVMDTFWGVHDSALLQC
jgi:hypothetical protein